MVNKYLALKGEDKFDINKITVVGNPTITSDGIASGFSASNYVKIPYVADRSKTWTQYIEFTTSSDVITQQRIWAEDRPFSNAYTSRFILDSSKKIAYRFTSDGASFIGGSINRLGTHIIQTNTKYILKAEFTGISYNMYLSINGSDYELDYSLQSTDVLENLPSVLGFWSEYPFLGSIDLKQFKIYVDGELVFSPTKPTYLLERRKQKVWNKGQFEIVGNPSISEDGIASGFSTNDYVTLGSDIINKLVNATNFNFTFRFRTGNSLGGLVIGFNNNISGGPFSLWVSTSQVAPIMFLNAGGTATLKSIGNINKSIYTNTEYEAFFSKEGNNYGFGIRALTESDFTQSAGITNTETIYANTQTIGRNTILNSIDLTQFSITVDGQEVFTGAKVGYYVLWR